MSGKTKFPRAVAMAVARHMAMALCREHTTATMAEIGKVFFQTHSNVVHSLKAVHRACELPDVLSRARATQYFELSAAVQWRLELRAAVAPVLTAKEIKKFCRV